MLAEAADALPDADEVRAASTTDGLAAWESLNRDLSCVVVDLHGAVAGLSLVEEDGPTQHVVITYVRPQFRGQGVGRELKAHTSAYRARHRWLVTQIDGANEPILHLNSSLGFVDITPVTCLRTRSQ